MRGSACGHRCLRLSVFFVSILGALPLFAANGDFLGLEERLVSLFEENKSALVRVKAIYPSEEDEEVPQVVIGTGFFISREGLILTNASIVYQPLRVWIEHDGIAYSADVVGFDERSNIAFLRTHTLPTSFTFLHLTDSSELPPVASFTLRLSMPLEFETSPELGIVSGYESRFGERFFPCTYIRTTIPAGPGDGGSAYLDLKGRLLGIQVGSLPDVGSSYVLPARAALRIRDDILFSGKVTYGWIGFEVEIKTSIDKGQQLFLSQIFPQTPAEEAGLLEGDVLVQIGEYPIRVLDDLRNAMFYTRVGQYVDVRINRKGENRRFSVKVSARPEDEPMQVVEPKEPEPPVKPVKEKTEPEDLSHVPYLEDLKKDETKTLPPDEVLPQAS